MRAGRAILVPLDGSGFAENALPVALNLARRTQASIHLVRVHAQLPLWELGAEVVVVSPEAEQRIFEREQVYLKSVAGRCTGQGLTVSTAVVKGEIVPALREYSDANEISLVVMTSHGWGGLRRAMLGSVADHMVRSSSLPVLIVTPEMTPRVTPEWPRRILVPLDGSELAESALDLVRELTAGSATEIVLTMVLQTNPPMLTPWMTSPEIPVDPTEQREPQVRAYVEQVARTFRQENRVAHTRVRVGAKVAREILQVAILERCDLIVLATHGAGGLDRVMFGSVADQVVRHALVPVLAVRPREAGRSARKVGSKEREQAGVA